MPCILLPCATSRARWKVYFTPCVCRPGYRLAGDGPSCHFVDLPGYGYAKVSRSIREEAWARLISTYLRSSQPIALALQLLDLRRERPTDLDMQMIDWLRDNAVPHAFVLTKSDKLARGKRTRAASRYATVLSTPRDAAPIAYSSVTGEGKRALWSTIDSRVAAAPSTIGGTGHPGETSKVTNS